MPETTILIDIPEELMSFLQMEAFCRGITVEELAAQVLTDYKVLFDINLNVCIK